MTVVAAFTNIVRRMRNITMLAAITFESASVPEQTARPEVLVSLTVQPRHVHHWGVTGGCIEDCRVAAERPGDPTSSSVSA